MYNHHLPQRALGHVSPIDAMKQWQEKKAGVVQEASECVN
jgi:hypothetical protein